MKEQIFILVKTYPTLSKKYFELVCTAGINKNGEWRRIYPIPFRQLSDLEKYEKYQWVEVNIERDFSDFRKESYRLVPQATIKKISPVITTDKDRSWRTRKKLIFSKTKVYTNLEEIINKANNENELSLAIFKPSEITDFSYKKDSEDWDEKKLRAIEADNQQLKLFEEYKKEIKIVRKLPYKFYYHFKDDAGKKAKLMIEDWEIGQLYWNCLKRKNKEEALKDIVEKYKKDFINNKDIYFFVGTTRQFHGWAKNPFVIVGVFYPPPEGPQQMLQF